jgi:hypothetical protein
MGFRGEKVMILSSFIDIPGQFVSGLFQRQWAEWEIITIAVIVVVVLLWIIRQQRKRGFRNIYDNKFLESTPVIGTKLGSRKRRRHIIKDFKKAQLAAAQQGQTKQQKSTKQTEPGKLREQIRQLQREIIKHKESKVRLEQQVAEITAVKDELQRELAEVKQTEKPAELKDEIEPTSEEQPQLEIPKDKQPEQPVISDSEHAEQDTVEQKAEVPAEDESIKRRPPRRSKKYEDLHRIVDGVKQKLCRKCNEWKPESEFHKNASSKDGLAGSCKACKAEAAKEYRRRRKTDQD